MTIYSPPCNILQNQKEGALFVLISFDYWVCSTLEPDLEMWHQVPVHNLQIGKVCLGMCLPQHQKDSFPAGSYSLYDARDYFEGEELLDLSTETSIYSGFSNLLSPTMFACWVDFCPWDARFYITGDWWMWDATYSSALPFHNLVVWGWRLFEVVSHEQHHLVNCCYQGRRGTQGSSVQLQRKWWE